jgi:hypothetical protein
MRRSWLAALLLLAAGPALAEPVPEAALVREIESLRAGGFARGGLGWQTCLLAAAADARQRGRPLLLWVFGGDPVEGRC